MSVANTLIQPDSIRGTLQEFWNGALEIASTRAGVALALPLCYPDGWQVLVDIETLTPQALRLTDSGRTLHWLAGNGQNIGTPAFKACLDERMQTFGLHREDSGWELFRELPMPLQGADLHLFGEALVSIAHLHYLHEPAIKTQNVATETVEKVFRERKIEALQNHRLNGRVEQRIAVDYFVEAPHPVALQVLGRRGAVTSYMEQWGFRWRDLRDANPRLLPGMIYDPAVQEIDSTATAIGESVCELFCPYYETDRIHALLDRAQAGN